MKSFITNSAKNSVQFELDGRRYKFKYPKLSALLTVAASVAGDEDGNAAAGIAQLPALLDWFWQGLRGTGAETLKARLADPDDDLDELQLLNVINWLLGEMGKDQPGE